MNRNRKLHIKNVAFDKTHGNYFELFATSSLSACHAELYSYPMKIANTRLQINTDGKFVGLFGVTQDMIKNEGFFSMYHGLSKTLIRCAIFNSLRIVQYDFLRDLCAIYKADGSLRTSSMLSIMCSAIAGGLSEGLFCPIDKIKENIRNERKKQMEPKQSNYSKYKNMYLSFNNIMKTKGIKGLYCGSSPKTVRSILLTIGDTAGYDMSKSSIGVLTGLPDDLLLQFLASVSAATFATMLLAPTELIQARLMSQAFIEPGREALYKNAWDCISKIFKQEGIFTFYGSFAPLWLRIGPWTIAFWLSVEKTRSLFGSPTF